MNPFIFVVTYFLASGVPVYMDTEYPEYVTTKQGKMIYDKTDCLEAATDKRRKFLDSIRGSDNLFIDIRVECERAK